MKDISVTNDVIKLVKINVFNEEHPLNIPCIFVTRDVLKFVKSKLLKDEQPSNI